MVYSLVLTTLLYRQFQKSPASVTTSSHLGYTTEQACKNAGRAHANAVNQTFTRSGENMKMIVIFSCSPTDI
jgi:hypothetical protein